VARSWDEGRKEGRWDRQHLSDEEERQIQKSISDTMKSVVADQLGGRAYDPWRGSGGGATATPGGAGKAVTPGVWDGDRSPEAGEPWKPMHPTQDWLRLGSTVASANLERAEAALAKLEKGEEEPKK
jgi:hypothetical protein